MQKSWEEHFGLLLEFRHKHGHCRVPRGYESGGLGAWVKQMRFEYTAYKCEGRSRPPSMSRDRLDAMNEIGFIWNAHHPTLAMKRKMSWEDYFELLLEFRDEHGHCRVPSAYPGVLGPWVKRMRREHVRFTRGGSKSLSQDRVDAMNGVGFVWIPQTTGTRIKLARTIEKSYQPSQQSTSLESPQPAQRAHKLASETRTSEKPSQASPQPAHRADKLASDSESQSDELSVEATSPESLQPMHHSKAERVPVVIQSPLGEKAREAPSPVQVEWIPFGARSPSDEQERESPQGVGCIIS